MSTVTQAQPATRDGAPTRLLSAPTRLVSPPLALTFLAESSSLTSFFLLLSVLPMLAAAAGASSSGAGLITGSLLLGTVAAEAVAASGIRRFGYRTMLAAGAALLGAPALALLPREPQAVMMGVSFVRGLGFGLCGVTTGALAATLLPPGRRGEGLGLLGAGFGVIENATFALIEQLPEARASTLWNLAYDAGYGAGPAAFGLFAARTGYPATFALTGVVVLAVLPAALRERKGTAGTARPV